MIDWNDISTWHVMVIDDEPDNLEVVAETLEFRGAQVKTAPNGKEALEALQGFEATLILTDLSMPVMDGWVLRSQVKTDPKTAHLPVLALSAHAIAGDQERALEAGFDGYLTKPVNILTLVDDIRSAAITPNDNTEEASQGRVETESVQDSSVAQSSTETLQAQAEAIESSTETLQAEAVESSSEQANNNKPNQEVTS